MPKEIYTAREAASARGRSLDTLRRWDKAGRIDVQRASGNRRVVPSSEIERVRGDRGSQLSARNRFRGFVTDVQIEGLMAQVEIVVRAPVRLVAIVTRDAVEELGLKTGMTTTAVVKATSVMVES